MAHILLAWELGEGLGHLVGLKPLVEELLRRGHRLSVALKDVSRGPLIFDADVVQLLQAPTKNRRSGDEIDVAWNFAHVLHNTGFSTTADLSALIAAWRNLLQLVQPDVVLLEHSPTALIAARTLDLPRILVGTGFVCPPDVQPLPNLRFWESCDESKLALAEVSVLANVNQVLERLDASPLNHLAQLYGEVDDQLLVTFAELDHYPQRIGAVYWGAATHMSGTAPEWAPGERKKVFAYLKPFPKSKNSWRCCGTASTTFSSMHPG